MATVTQNETSNGTSNGASNGTTNGTANGASVPRRIFLFTHGRTASNLLMTLFAKQPQLAITDYNFHNAYMFGPERLMTPAQNMKEILPPERLKACEKASYQNGFDGLQEFITKAEAEVSMTSSHTCEASLTLVLWQGKIPFVKEHSQFILNPRIVAENRPNPAIHQVPAKPIVVDHSTSQSNGTVDPSTSSATSTNPTVLPDSFLETMSPIIVIRHPARMIPSFYRAIQESNLDIDINDGDFPIQATFRWSRLIFDWYAQDVCGTASLPGPYKKSERTSPSWPIVVDGDDLINDNNVAQDLCKQLEIDPQHLQLSWDATPEEQKKNQGPVITRFLSTIQKSTGIIKSGKTDDLDLEKEREKLVEQFGEELGNMLMGFIKRAMPDYMFLREYRI